MRIPERVNDLIPCMPAGGPSICSDKQHFSADCVMLLHMCKLTLCNSQRVLQQDTDSLSAVRPTPQLTLQAVGAISELHGEVVVGGAVGVQRPRHLPAADEAVLPTQHDDRAVNQLHDELLGLAWRQTKDAPCLLESGNEQMTTSLFQCMLQ